MVLTREEEGSEGEVLNSAPYRDSIQPKGASDGWHRNVIEEWLTSRC